MPVKITFEKTSVSEQIDKLRKTIRDGEGMTVREVCSAVQRGPSTVKRIMESRGWSIKQFSIESRTYLNLLVNPKTLKECRKK